MPCRLLQWIFVQETATKITREKERDKSDNCGADLAESKKLSKSAEIEQKKIKQSSAHI